MTSMTGYGHAEQASGQRRISVEIKSYNSRYLEVNVGVPAGYAELEQRLRAAVGERVARGRVELSLAVEDLTEGVQVRVNTAAARAYLEALRKLSAVADGGPVTLSHLLAVRGFLGEQLAHDVEVVWAECRGPLEQAFEQFQAARHRDGAVTAADVAQLLTDLEAEVNGIEVEAPLAAQRVQTTLAARVQKELAALADSVDEGRVLAALAAVLARGDINEELVRLRGHLGAFRDSLGTGERAKKLEFVSQEMMREVNTVAAKGAAYAISAAAVRAKDAIERIREHLRNVE